MSIFSKIAEIGRKKAAKPRGISTNKRLWTSWLPQWIRGDYTMQNSELLFSAVSRISNALSAMPVRLYRGTTPVNNDVRSDLVAYSPNPNMTPSSFFKTMEACRDTYGNNYALILRDADFQPEKLKILDPARVKPVMDMDSDELFYRIQPEQGGEYYIHNAHVIHVPFISTNGYMGVNPVSVLFDTLSYAENIQKFSISQLNRGINATVVIEAPAQLGADQKEKAMDDLMTVYKNAGGNALMLESGLTAKTLNLSPVDTKLFEVEKITRGKVAMVYNIPPHLLGDYSDTSFATMEQQMIEFLTLTMLPIVTAYENELNRKLLTKEDYRKKYRFKFNMDSILRADAATQADVNFKAVRSGHKLINEIRAEKGDPGVKWGNQPLISGDLVPLDYIMTMAKGEAANGKVGESESPEQEPGESGEGYRADQPIQH